MAQRTDKTWRKEKVLSLNMGQRTVDPRAGYQDTLIRNASFVCCIRYKPVRLKVCGERLHAATGVAIFRKALG